MKKAYKVLLTSPSILYLSYLITMWFPLTFDWLTPTIKVYYIQLAILNGLVIIQLYVLIKKIWSFKAIDKSKKIEWTCILLFFYSIGSILFIWQKVDNMEEKNNLLLQKQTY